MSQSASELTASVAAFLTGGVPFVRIRKGRYDISPERFARVGALMRAGRIRVTTNPALSRPRYQVEDDTMELPAYTTFTDRTWAAVVHEACHAISDTRFKNVWVLDEEAVAFVAQAMYLEHNGVPRDERHPPATAAVDVAARALARVLLDNKVAQPELWARLERAIEHHPEYRLAARVRTMDGVRGDDEVVAPLLPQRPPSTW